MLKLLLVFEIFGYNFFLNCQPAKPFSKHWNAGSSSSSPPSWSCSRRCCVPSTRCQCDILSFAALHILGCGIRSTTKTEWSVYSYIPLACARIVSIFHPKREELCQHTECATKSPSVHEHRTKWKSAMRFYPSVPYTFQPSHTKIIMRQNVRCKEQHAERFIFFCSFLLLLLLDGMVWYTAHTRSA